MLEVALEIVRDERMLMARFARPQRFLSWAIVAGGASRGQEVAWCQVKDGELIADGPVGIPYARQ